MAVNERHGPCAIVHLRNPRRGSGEDILEAVWAFGGLWGRACMMGATVGQVPPAMEGRRIPSNHRSGPLLAACLTAILTGPSLGALVPNAWSSGDLGHVSPTPTPATPTVPTLDQQWEQQGELDAKFKRRRNEHTRKVAERNRTLLLVGFLAVLAVILNALVGDRLTPRFLLSRRAREVGEARMRDQQERAQAVAVKEEEKRNKRENALAKEEEQKRLEAEEIARSERRMREHQETLDGLQQLSGSAFETLVARLFERDGFRVERQGGGCDEGVDLFVLMGPSEREVVQCKRWGRIIGSAVVREFYGSLLRARARYGYVITSTRFTDNARSFVSGKPITLIDGKCLLAWVYGSQTPKDWPRNQHSRSSTLHRPR